MRILIGGPADGEICVIAGAEIIVVWQRGWVMYVDLRATLDALPEPLAYLDAGFGLFYQEGYFEPHTNPFTGVRFFARPDW